jgi:hypothetical protein
MDRDPTYQFDIVEPHADALIESLRALGYTPASAIADLIDNSISAGARTIWLDFTWAGESSRISVRDDGRGMALDVLVSALRPGSLSPTAAREKNDLGRFGLGLKTASFSQCRRVTVATRSSGESLAIRRWDLDYVSQQREWRLLHGPAAGSESLVNVHEPTGTQVLWEVMDRIVGEAKEGDLQAYRRFLDLIDDVESHVAMVFHRFMSRARGIAIYINEHRVQPWDPFLSQHPATQRLAESRLSLNGERMLVVPYILPHHSKLSREEHRAAAGPRSWNAQQGFYVYRNDRLLLTGDWMNLGVQKEEHFKLARIALDFPAALDHEWAIDVRKSRARPPGPVRDELRVIARKTRERASEVYRHRGKALVREAQPDAFVWTQKLREGTVEYQLNRTHPLIKQAIDSANGDRPLLNAALQLIEQTVPVPLIALTNAERPDLQPVPYAHARAAVVDLLRMMHDALRSGGATSQQARQKLLSMEPFMYYPELLALLDQTDSSGDPT